MTSWPMGPSASRCVSGSPSGSPQAKSTVHEGSSRLVPTVCSCSRAGAGQTLTAPAPRATADVCVNLKYWMGDATPASRPSFDNSRTPLRHALDPECRNQRHCVERCEFTLPTHQQRLAPHDRSNELPSYDANVRKQTLSYPLQSTSAVRFSFELNLHPLLPAALEALAPAVPIHSTGR